MLGVEYKELEPFYRDFQSIIWCTYRRNFPRLLSRVKDIDAIYTNDTGWGCMIRATQMMFAEVLSRKLRHEYPDSNKRKEAIIASLLDGEDLTEAAPYSIHSICEQLYENHKIKPGQWFKASQILLALESVHKAHRKILAEDLEIAIFLEGTIYLDQILNRVCPEPKNEFEDISFKDFDPDLEEIKREDEQSGFNSRKCHSCDGRKKSTATAKCRSVSPVKKEKQTTPRLTKEQEPSADVDVDDAMSR